MRNLTQPQATTEYENICPACNGRGWPLDDPEFLAGGAPHAECVTCEGTGRTHPTPAPSGREQPEHAAAAMDDETGGQG